MLTRFIQNAGGKNSVRCLLVLLLLGFAIAKDCKTSLAMVTLPIVAGGLLLPWMVRSLLTYHFDVVKAVMNAFAILCIVVSVVVPKPEGVEPPLLRVALAAVFSLYIGIYFCVLSSDRIERI